MRKSGYRGLEKNNRDAYLFLIPWFIGITVLGIIPIFSSLYLAFTDYKLLTAPTWIGLKNFTRLIRDDLFYQSLKVTFTYVFLGVPLSNLIALIIALALVRNFRGAGIFRATYYLPSLLGGSVAIAVLWRVIFSQEGAVNMFLANFGIQGESWIGDPRYALFTLIALRMWQFGSPMLIFIAGLKQVPEELYECASMEGAGYFRRLWHITLPILSPIILFNAVMAMISAFQDFTPAYIISGGSGGPVASTLFYSLYLYQKGFTSFQMGYAAMMAWVLLLIIAAFTFLLFKSSSKKIHYEA